MSGTDSKDRRVEFACPFSAGTDFEEAVVKAWKLLKNDDLDAALVLLAGLEKRYVRAVKVFDLLGDVHIRRGNIEEGVRYKSLHEILRGTFKIAGEERKVEAADLPGAIEAAGIGDKPLVSHEVGGFAPVQEEEKPVPGVSDFDASGGLFPVTRAMADEFVKQGHYERAVEIYDMLLAKNPDDRRLKEAKAEALRLNQKEKVLGILKGWLGSIEQMRAELAPEQ